MGWRRINGPLGHGDFKTDMVKIISPLQDQTQNPWESFISYMTPPVSPVPGRQQSALGQAVGNFMEAKRLQIKPMVRGAIRNIVNQFPSQVQATTPSRPDYKSIFSSPTPTPTMTPSPTPTPGITPYPMPTYSKIQQSHKTRVKSDAGLLGINPDVFVGISNNESSMKPTTTPNINQNEESYGPFQINFKIRQKDGTVVTLKNRDGLTREDAQDYNKAKVWAANQLKRAEGYFPNSVDRQILYYNIPGNVFRTREEGGGIRPAEEISYDAAWYLANALRSAGKTPSPEYLPILQKYGFFK